MIIIQKQLSIFLSILLLLTFSGCDFFSDSESSSSESASSEEVLDEESGYPVDIRGVTLSTKPQRVVSLSAGITEKIYDLQMEDVLVGVSTFCVYPTEATSLPICGTAQIPAVDDILSLDADLVISSSPLPATTQQQLEENGVGVLVLEGARSVSELTTLYLDLAQALQGDETGLLLGQAQGDLFTMRLQSIQDALQSSNSDLDTPVLYLRQLPFVVATGDTLEGDMLSLAGFENIAQDFSEWSYPQEDAESEEGTTAFQSVQMLFIDDDEVSVGMLEQDSFYRVLPCVINDNYTVIDYAAFERQGMSSLDELLKMAQAVWPDVEFPNWADSSDFSAQEPEESIIEPQDSD